MFKRMGIDGKDVRVLHKVFDEMDLDGNKRIDTVEVHFFYTLCIMPTITSTPIQRPEAIMYCSSFNFSAAFK